MFPEYVRVAQVDTDWELSVTRSMFDATPNGYVLLDEPATDSGNNPLPPTPKASAPDVEDEDTPDDRSSASGTTGHEADTTEES